MARKSGLSTTRLCSSLHDVLRAVRKERGRANRVGAQSNGHHELRGQA